MLVSLALPLIGHHDLGPYLGGDHEPEEEADPCARSVVHHEEGEVRRAVGALDEDHVLQIVVPHLDAEIVPVAEALLEHVVGAEVYEDIPESGIRARHLSAYGEGLIVFGQAEVASAEDDRQHGDDGDRFSVADIPGPVTIVHHIATPQRKSLILIFMPLS